MLKPAIIKRNDKVYLAVPPVIYLYYQSKKLSLEDFIILDNIYYIHILKLNDPLMEEALLNRVQSR